MAPPMRPLAWWAVLLILMHTAVVGVHSAAHLVLGIAVPEPAAVHGTVIAIAFYAAPLVAAIGVNREVASAKPLMFFTFSAGLAYGAAYHFVLPGADNVAGAGTAGWGPMFLLTSTQLLLLEAGGAVIGWKLWRTAGPPPAPTL